MAKSKTAYVCNDCGSDYSKWQGQCNDCSAWNTLSEIRLGPTNTTGGRAGSGLRNAKAGFAGVIAEAKVLGDIDLDDLPRFSSGAGEFDRVLGGGLVPGSAILLGGNPGAGKSTLLLQTMCHLASSMEALYVTGEESLQQVAMRAKRLKLQIKPMFLCKAEMPTLAQVKSCWLTKKSAAVSWGDDDDLCIPPKRIID